MTKGTWMPRWVPPTTTRMVEGALAGIVALVIMWVPVRSTAELGMILFIISLGLLVVLGLAELRTWWRWTIR